MDNSDALDPNESTAPSRGTSSKWLKPKATAASSGDHLTETEKIELIRGLSSNERRAGLAYAAATVVIAILVAIVLSTVKTQDTVIPVDGKCPNSNYTLVRDGNKGAGPSYAICQSKISQIGGPALFDSLIVLGAVAVGISAQRKRRSWLTFAVVLTGLLLMSVPLTSTFALLYLGFGAWLLLRSSRLQKQTGGRAAHALRLREERDQKRAARTGGSRSTRPTPSSTAPKANKRYTPKNGARGRR
jgi:hypothetical protein